ncbi:MAG: HAMP domain-containing histidine kinase [Anaerococcus sp.]|uniref:sensor histidine kinase n=1 Tax=Anaerococcus sp. TaxID=1872515 RepID=UPI002613BC36|nr:HAMP domain-containing sensor histidine kinase [Anaerococcus sp.]MCI5972565.1 HAMP domain-containing histidine kinase [Anaerococcus sp.]MDD6919356.1 HAMP domain-containing sensor histidine kinase [Peptoniphilaceae bacterium]MDY2928095.1 HAMP domain-containing sensor histidine kinase [Anaerococcus sp.]
MEVIRNDEFIDKEIKSYNNKSPNDSIKFNVIKIVMFFVITVVIGFEIFAYNSIRSYYESALTDSMKNQARINQLQFSNYMNRYDLSDIIIGDKNIFYRSNDTQVQILDNSGVVLFDSIASDLVGNTLESSDVKSAIEGKQDSTKSKRESTGESLLSLSYPLVSANQQVGIIRLTSSMDKVDKRISDDTFWYVIFGIIVSLLALVVSFFAASSFVKPINDLIKVSEKLASGDYTAKASIRGNNEITELANTLNSLSDNIIQREDMKNDFISSVSHELRTPLTSIKGWAITLQAPEMQKNEDMMGQGLKIIEDEGDRLSMMVEDLLDFSRLSSSSFKYDKEKLDIVELSKQIHTQLFPRTQSQNIGFNFVTIYKEIPVFADKNRMKEVLINIIDNAIKFTSESGQIDLIIDQEDGNVLITVKDNGEGIKEDEIAFVASKFYKGSSSKSQTGLGLSICEEIVKAHSGKLVIKSQYGVGTSVTVQIPRYEDEESL